MTPDIAAIHTWIRDDLPLSMKMIITPHHIAALVTRLEAARQGPASVDVELAREVRRVNEPHLQPNHEALRSDGWALVPREADDAMMEAAFQAARATFTHIDGQVGYSQLRAAWGAMLAALPDPLVVLEGGKKGGDFDADLSRASSSPGPHSDGGGDADPS